ncbi:MAG: DUF4160 domain-containing protein [Cyanobacteria bacterium]|nr:DUF4160 domain-containing protein [Cyanobacteriota bacterium]MDA1020261.1 DUF4160 domain-containing protein [Cyanobacteriota bacterium]
MSPTILRFKAYRLFFFSNEGSPLEPIHVHIRKGQALAKFWLELCTYLSENYGFNSKELKEIEELIRKNEQEIKTKWNQYFSE